MSHNDYNTETLLEKHNFKYLCCQNERKLGSERTKLGSERTKLGSERTKLGSERTYFVRSEPSCKSIF